MALKGFGHRVRRAWHLWASQQEVEVKYGDFGAAIGQAEEPPRDAYSSSMISEWIAERSVPKASAYLAMARVTGFREGWLIGGKKPEKGISVDELRALIPNLKLAANETAEEYFARLAREKEEADEAARQKRKGKKA